MLRDVVDLRENQWIPRRDENYNAKTIDQIHKEAQMEKIQKRRLAAQLPSKNNKEKKGAAGNKMEK
jgi:translation initiation factor 4G